MKNNCQPVKIFSANTDFFQKPIDKYENQVYNV